MISSPASPKLSKLSEPQTSRLGRQVFAGIARLKAASTGSLDDARRQDKSKSEEYLECVRLLPFLACADRYGRADAGLPWVSQWSCFRD